MTLTPHEIAVAQKMHESVSRFENARDAYRPSWYALPLLLVVITVETVDAITLPLIIAAWALVFAAIAVQPFRTLRLKKRYARERSLLEVLEREHGDQLPWVAEGRPLIVPSDLERTNAKKPVAS